MLSVKYLRDNKSDLIMPQKRHILSLPFILLMSYICLKHKGCDKEEIATDKDRSFEIYSDEAEHAALVPPSGVGAWTVSFLIFFYNFPVNCYSLYLIEIRKILL